LGARFSSSVQTALWPTHPPIQWHRVSFPEIGQPGAWRRPHTSSSASGPSWPVKGWNSPLPLPLYPTRVTCSAHIILNLITRIIYTSRRANYSYLTRLILLPTSQAQLSSSSPHSRTPSAFVLPLKCETKFHTHTKH